MKTPPNDGESNQEQTETPQSFGTPGGARYEVTFQATVSVPSSMTGFRDFTDLTTLSTVQCSFVRGSQIAYASGRNLKILTMREESPSSDSQA